MLCALQVSDSWRTRHLRRLSAFILCVCTIAPGSFINCRGFPSTGTHTPLRRIVPRQIATNFHGAAITIKPEQGRLAIKATITNSGRSSLFLFQGGFDGWHVFAFDDKGRSLQRIRDQSAFTGVVRFRAGASTSHIFTLAHYFRWRPAKAEPDQLGTTTHAANGGEKPPIAGTFYVYVMRQVATKTASAFVKSPILKLELRPGAAPAWREVNVIPHPKIRRTATHVLPPLPAAYPIPGTGPIVTLATIDRAVHAGNMQEVQQLCCHEPTTPFYVAAAQAAVDAKQVCAIVQKKFGKAAAISLNQFLTSTGSSPDTFSRFVRELDPRSLRITHGTATVGVVYFHLGKFVRVPSFKFCFRRIHGRWLLDSRATMATAGIANKMYRLNVGNALRKARIFASLSNKLAAGRFATLSEFQHKVDQQLAENSERFMARVKFHPVHRSGPQAVTVQVPQKNYGFSGVRMTLMGNPNQATVIAIIKNYGRHTVTLWNGGVFGWSLSAFASDGRSLAPTSHQQSLWRASAPAQLHTSLTPGASLAKHFHVRHFWMIPRTGTFYVCVRRFVTLGGFGGYVQSPVLKLVLKKGPRLVWKTVQTMPQPKFRPRP